VRDLHIARVGRFRYDDTVIVSSEPPELITNCSKRLEGQIVQS